MNSLLSLVAALASLIQILMWFRVEPHHLLLGKGDAMGSKTVTLSRSTFRGMVGLAMISLLLSSVGLYKSLYPDMLHFRDSKITTTIRQQTFANENVELDGKLYEDCTFSNVTFVYHGIGTFGLLHNNIVGTKWVSTNNDTVVGTIYLLKALKLLKEDIPIIGPDKKPIDIN